MQTSGSTSERNCKPSWISNERTKKHTFAKDFSLSFSASLYSAKQFPDFHCTTSGSQTKPKLHSFQENSEVKSEKSF
jgi:hypothetical protein